MHYRDNHLAPKTILRAYLVELPIESIIILLNPIPLFLDTNYYNIFVIRYYETTLIYKDNDLLNLLSLGKVIILIRACMSKTVWRSDKSYRVCQMFGMEEEYLFVFRCLMYHRPFFLSFIWNFLGVLLFAFALHIAESPVRLATDHVNLSNFGNCIWVVFNSMTTVGYGDLYPRTPKGQFIIVFCAVYGIIGFSLIVLAVANHVMLSSREKRAYVLLKRLALKTKQINLAKQIISKGANLYKYKNSSEIDAEDIIDEINVISDKFERVTEKYNHVKSEAPSDDKHNHTFVFVHSKLVELRKDVEDLCSKLDIDTKKVIEDANYARIAHILGKKVKRSKPNSQLSQ